MAASMETGAAFLHSVRLLGRARLRPLLPGAYPADAFGALLRRLCRRSARRAGFDAAGAEGQRPTLVYDSCFESGGYEKTPAGNTQREAF